MNRATVIPAGGGEVVGDSPDRRVEILCDHAALNATWSRFGPRREGADLHVHRRHTDLFYVLEGELTVLLGQEGRPVTVAAGTLVRVPPLVIHGFRNGTDTELRYLNLHAPGVGFADYMRAMREGRKLAYDQHEPPRDGGRPAAEAVTSRGPGMLVDTEEIAIEERASESGAAGDRLVTLYVLEGELAVTVGDRELRAQTGSWVNLPPGVEHVVSPGPERVRYLELHAPGAGR